MRRHATIRPVLALLALLASGCGQGQSPAAAPADPVDWHAADACAGVQASDLAELAAGALSQQRLDDPARAGCVFLDRSGADRFSAALVYLGYDPRDLALLSPQAATAPVRAWQRQFELAGRSALVVAESANDCQIVLPLSGEQEGWGVRMELAPASPPPNPLSCSAHLSLLGKAVRGLPDVLLVAPGSTTSASSAPPGSGDLADSCAQLRSAQARTGAMTLPFLDAAGKPLSTDTAAAMRISKPAAVGGLLEASSVARRLAARPLPTQLRTELKLFARNADLFRATLQGPLQTGDSYLRLALAVQVNEAKALTFCPV